METFDELEKARIEAGLSVREWARRAGVTENAIHRLRSGSRGMSQVTAHRLRTALAGGVVVSRERDDATDDADVLLEAAIRIFRRIPTSAERVQTALAVLSLIQSRAPTP